MRVFYSTDFRGYWPVGTAAVVVARDRDEAWALLKGRLSSMGLWREGDHFTVDELSTEKESVVMLHDGNY